MNEIDNDIKYPVLEDAHRRFHARLMRTPEWQGQNYRDDEIEYLRRLVEAFERREEYIDYRYAIAALEVAAEDWHDKSHDAGLSNTEMSRVKRRRADIIRVMNYVSEKIDSLIG